MPATHVSGRHAHLSVSIDGIAFSRSESDALRRDTPRIHQVEWDDVRGAALEMTGKGRAVVRVAVRDAPAVADHRADPFAVKVARNQAGDARDLVAHINAEAAVRRRWRESSETA